MNGIQAWVALPKEDEETDPAFAHYADGQSAGIRGRRTLDARHRRRSLWREG